MLVRLRHTPFPAEPMRRSIRPHITLCLPWFASVRSTFPDPTAARSLAVPDVFAAFVRNEHAPLCAFLRARGATAEDAEDMAQDCMERLLRYQAHAPAELRPLLYRIARNRLIDRGRSSSMGAAQLPVPAGLSR